MKYNQLQESIIKVPTEISKTVNMYVSSYLCFKIKQYLERMDIFVSPNMSDEEKRKIIKDGNITISKLQSKYGAKNISSETANNLINNTIDIPFDVEKFFSELNYKGINHGLIALLKNKLKLSLLIKQNSNGILGSKEQSSDYSFLITIVTGVLGPRPSFLENASNIMSTVYHELQHVVQSMAIQNISNNDKQLQRNQGYSDRDGDNEEYYTSGIEFTPQLGNLIDSVILELEKNTLKNELNPNKNYAIKDAIHNALQNNNESRQFLIHLYRNKPELYKKSMIAMYKYATPVYNNFKINGIDYSFTELPSEELEINTNVMLSVYKMMYQKEQYDIKAYGRNLDNIIKLDIRAKSWSIELTKNEIRKDSYFIDIFSSDPKFDENEKMNSKEVLNLFGILSDISWYDAVDIIDDIEFITGQRKEVTNESISDIIQSLESDADELNVPFEILDYNSFQTMGHTFKIESVENSADKVDILQDNGSKTYYVWSLKQVLISFQMMIRLNVYYKDEIQNILSDSNIVMYVEVMSQLREL